MVTCNQFEAVAGRDKMMYRTNCRAQSRESEEESFVRVEGCWAGIGQKHGKIAAGSSWEN